MNLKKGTPLCGLVTGAVLTLVGALVMVWADAAARTLFRPEELPIGILTASLGAPVFMWIISRKYKDY